MKTQIIVLLSRKESNMWSSCTSHLGLEKITDESWRLGVYTHNWLGLITDLVPEDQLYDDAGELIIPDEWDGHKISSLNEDGYLETDELISSNYLDFNESQVELARDFCLENRWGDLPDFDNAFHRLVITVTPNLRFYASSNNL